MSYSFFLFHRSISANIFAFQRAINKFIISGFRNKSSMTYDLNRHLLQQTVYPDKNWQINTSYTYYSNGALKTATNAKGVTETYIYDANGNKTSSKYGTDAEIKYEYNTFGMMTKVTDQLNAASDLISDIQFGNGNKTVYKYDGAGRMTGLSHVDTANFADYHAILDEAGYPVSISENFPYLSIANSNNFSYTYNANGIRLTAAGGKSMTYDNEGQTTAKGTETYTFNIRHQLETVTGVGYRYQ